MLAVWSVGMVVIGCCAMAYAAPRTGSSSEEAFEAAYYREVVMGDPTGAIDQYSSVVKQSAVDRATAAKALLEIGLCQEKLGRRKDAFATYTRVTSEFGDQPEIVKRAAIKLAAWSGPRNLKFQDGAAGKAPPGWFVPSLPKDADYLAELRRDQCRSRSGCAVILAPANVPNATGYLMQSFSAAAYAGKTIRLRAWLRLEALFVSPSLGLRLPSNEDRGQLWLTVERSNRRKGFSATTDEHPVRTPEWAEAEIIGEIDKDAEFITFGIQSIGGGRVWVDDVSFDVIPSK